MMDDKKYCGFIYMTTNMINGKKYIGKRLYDKRGIWKEYLGSGVLLKRAIRKYGRQSFKRDIIDRAITKCAVKPLPLGMGI